MATRKTQDTSTASILQMDAPHAFQKWGEGSTTANTAFLRLAQLLAEYMGKGWKAHDVAPKKEDRHIMNDASKAKANELREEWKPLYPGEEKGYNMFFSRLEARCGWGRNASAGRKKGKGKGKAETVTAPAGFKVVEDSALTFRTLVGGLEAISEACGVELDDTLADAMLDKWGELVEEVRASLKPAKKKVAGIPRK